MKKQPFIFILIGLTIFIPQQLLFAESSLGSTDVSLIESKIVAIEQRIHSASTLSVRANKSLEIYRLLEQRQFLMLQLAKENRTEFLNIARKNFFTKIPSSVQKTAGHFMELPYGQEVSVFMMHEDDIGNNDSKIKVFFRDGQEELELYSRVATPPSLHGSLARLQGYKIGPAVVADTVQVVRQKEAEVLRKTTTAKLLVLLVDYEDAPRQVSREAVAEYFLGETSNIVKFFKEQSYGLFSFNFDILDWYRVPRQSNISITGQIESCGKIPV